MIRAAGAIFYSLEGDQVLLNWRSQEVSTGLHWGFFGGKIHQDEKILKGLSRELREEMGFIPAYVKVSPIDVFRSPDTNFLYYSILVLVEKPFCPRINSESGGWGWFKIDSLPTSLHPGARAVFSRKKIVNQILAFAEKLKNDQH